MIILLNNIRLKIIGFVRKLVKDELEHIDKFYKTFETQR